MVRFQFRRSHIDTDMDAAVESNAFGSHLFGAPVDEMFFHLEIGNAVAKKSADGLVLFIKMNIMADTRELLSRRHSGRA